MLEIFIALFLAFSCPAQNGHHNHQHGNGTVQTQGEDGGGDDDSGGEQGHLPPPPPPPHIPGLD